MSKKKEEEVEEEQKEILNKKIDLPNSEVEIGKKKNFSFIKVLLFISIFVTLVLILIVGFSFFDDNSPKFQKIPICGDGSFYNGCSLNKPYYCENGTLIKKASICDCPDNLTKKGYSCISEYQVEPKNISLNYILRGETNSINFTVYKKGFDYFNSFSEKNFYKDGKLISKKDFQFKKINDVKQRELLLPLIVDIENLANSKDDQARIAISLVQNIVYNSSNNLTFFFDGNSSTLIKYPYQTIYNEQGVCESKSELLTFLLKELGYGVSLFYYPEENHAAVGIKCPLEDRSYGSGYCFVETTEPSIITDNQEDYAGLKGLYTLPEISLISNGISFSENAYEYKDAKNLFKIDNLLKKRNSLGRIYQIRLKKLVKKYGLKDYEF